VRLFEPINTPITQVFELGLAWLATLPFLKQFRAVLDTLECASSNENSQGTLHRRLFHVFSRPAVARLFVSFYPQYLQNRNNRSGIVPVEITNIHPAGLSPLH